MVTKRPSSTDAGAFEPPNPPDLSSDADQASGGEEFIPPDGDGQLDSDAADSDVTVFLETVDSQILTAKSEIEKLLGDLAKEEDGPQSQAARDANVTGVGIGISDGTTVGALPGEPVLEVYTIESESAESLKARIASVSGVSALADKDFPLTTVRTGVIDAFSHRFRIRPAPGGVSVGHVRITAGTLGVLSRGRTAPRNQRLMILSNNHVLANSNAAATGDAIVQPGPYDGGRTPQDTIAVLEKFIPINFSGGNNLVDAATGWAWPDRVRKELVYSSGGRLVYFTVGSTPVGAVPGLLVGKTGRTTQLTSGRVTAIGVTVNVSYGGGRVARFINQIAVRAGSGDFSQGGDSGSLIWTWDSRRAPVGLLFAGGGGTTFANRISDVLTTLSINLVT